ncbi:unnamed protein product, partial [Prorocentrum cordatum]
MALVLLVIVLLVVVLVMVALLVLLAVVLVAVVLIVLVVVVLPVVGLMVMVALAMVALVEVQDGDNMSPHLPVRVRAPVHQQSDYMRNVLCKLTKCTKSQIDGHWSELGEAYEKHLSRYRSFEGDGWSKRQGHFEKANYKHYKQKPCRPMPCTAAQEEPLIHDIVMPLFAERAPGQKAEAGYDTDEEDGLLESEDAPREEAEGVQDRFAVRAPPTEGQQSPNTRNTIRWPFIVHTLRDGRVTDIDECAQNFLGLIATLLGPASRRYWKMAHRVAAAQGRQWATTHGERGAEGAGGKAITMASTTARQDGLAKGAHPLGIRMATHADHLGVATADGRRRRASAHSKRASKRVIRVGRARAPWQKVRGPAGTFTATVQRLGWKTLAAHSITIGDELLDLGTLPIRHLKQCVSTATGNGLMSDWLRIHGKKHGLDIIVAEPIAALLKRPLNKKWTREYQTRARNLWCDGTWPQRRGLDRGAAEDSISKACHEHEVTDRHRTYVCSARQDHRRRVGGHHICQRGAMARPGATEKQYATSEHDQSCKSELAAVLQAVPPVQVYSDRQTAIDGVARVVKIEGERMMEFGLFGTLEGSQRDQRIYKSEPAAVLQAVPPVQGYSDRQTVIDGVARGPERAARTDTTHKEVGQECRLLVQENGGTGLASSAEGDGAGKAQFPIPLEQRLAVVLQTEASSEALIGCGRVFPCTAGLMFGQGVPGGDGQKKLSGPAAAAAAALGGALESWSDYAGSPVSHVAKAASFIRFSLHYDEETSMRVVEPRRFVVDFPPPRCVRDQGRQKRHSALFSLRVIREESLARDPNMQGPVANHLRYKSTAERRLVPGADEYVEFELTSREHEAPSQQPLRISMGPVRSDAAT